MLETSSKLYGREPYQSALLNSIQNISSNRFSIITIEGASGVGKSSLIHSKDLYSTIKSTYFISGKFDKQSSEAGYAEFVNPFRELVEAIFSESDEQLLKLKRRFIKDMGENRKLLLKIMSL